MSAERSSRLKLDSVDGVHLDVTMVDDRVTIVGVHVESEAGVTLDQLRSIPLHRLEADWNAADSRVGKYVRAKARRAGGLAADRAEVAHLPEGAPTKREMRVRIPVGRKYPDEFYADVAQRYSRLVSVGIRPAPALAEANGVPVTTIHRWVKEARARGLLAPARRGGSTG